MLLDHLSSYKCIFYSKYYHESLNKISHNQWVCTFKIDYYSRYTFCINNSDAEKVQIDKACYACWNINLIN